MISACWDSHGGESSLNSVMSLFEHFKVMLALQVLVIRKSDSYCFCYIIMFKDCFMYVMIRDVTGCVGKLWRR